MATAQVGQSYSLLPNALLRLETSYTQEKNTKLTSENKRILETTPQYILLDSFLICIQIRFTGAITLDSIPNEAHHERLP